MKDFLIESTIALAVFIALYHLLFEKENMHRFKRFYLLSALVVSFVLSLPCISIPLYVQASEPVQAIETFKPSPNKSNGKIQDIIASAPATETLSPAGYDYIILATWCVYIIVALILAFRFTLNIYRFYTLARKNERIKLGKPTFVLLEHCPLPFTFINYIYISKKDYYNNTIEEELITHEIVHVKQKHTLDIIFIEIVKVIFWFNPFVYFYKVAIQTNHEFLADETTLKTHQDVKRYQEMLLAKATGNAALPFASSFSFKITKKRFLMMYKNTSRSKALAFKLVAASIISGISYFITTETIAMTESYMEDVRRDEYFSGVKIVIDDQKTGLFIDKPYEELTLQQKRFYLGSVPEKPEQISVSAKEANEWEYDTLIFLNDKKASLKEWEQFKKSGFKYAVASGGLAIYTDDYFNEQVSHIYDHYPKNIYAVTVTDTPHGWDTTERPAWNDKLTPLERMKEWDYIIFRYPGGWNKFYEYLSSSIDFSKIKSSSKLNINFDVNTNGALSDFYILEGDDLKDYNDKSAAEQIFTALANSPAWMPAQRGNGTPLRISTGIGVIIEKKKHETRLVFSFGDKAKAIIQK